MVFSIHDDCAVKLFLEGSPMRAENVLTTREAALKLGVSIRRLMALLAEGKLPGSYKVGLIWQIPQGAIKARFREKEVSFARSKR
jgi:hypothetical protein